MKPARFTNTETRPDTVQELQPKVVKKEKVREINVSYTALFILAGIILGFFVLISLGILYGVNKFFEARYLSFHSPIVLQSPLRVHDREPIIKEIIKEVPATSPVPSASPETATTQRTDVLDDIVRKVHMLETTAGQAPTGKHITCREKGMTNEFGYRAAEGFCFPTEEEAVETVKDWFKRSLEKRSLAASLCRYNIGTPTEDCEYYNNYLSLK